MPFRSKSTEIWIFCCFRVCFVTACLPCTLLVLQEKLNKEAVLGKVIGAVMGKKEGENVIDITTTVNMLPVFWEAEKASFFHPAQFSIDNMYYSVDNMSIVSKICLHALYRYPGMFLL